MADIMPTIDGHGPLYQQAVRWKEQGRTCLGNLPDRSNWTHADHVAMLKARSAADDGDYWKRELLQYLASVRPKRRALKR